MRARGLRWWKIAILLTILAMSEIDWFQQLSVNSKRRGRFFPLLQVRILRPGLLQDRDVRIGVFPKREKVFVGGECADAGSIGIGPLRRSADRQFRRSCRCSDDSAPRPPWLRVENARGLASLWLRRQELEGHKAAELYILSLVNHAHTAAAKFFDNAVVRDDLTDHWRECYVS